MEGSRSRRPVHDANLAIRSAGYQLPEVCVQDTFSFRGAAAATDRSDTGQVTFAPYLVVLEDDLELRSLVTRGLREEGFDVTAAGTASEMFEVVSGRDPDALVIDIGLPDADGRDVVQALRVQGVTAPVIFLTARDALPDRLSGFAAGGDDYLTKPFAFAELVARLHALIKRSNSDLAADVGDLRLDPATHAATCGGKHANLTPTEFRILARLASRPGDAVRRRQLIDAGWAYGSIVHDNTLDVYIARLRRKLAPAPRRAADHDDPRRRLLAPMTRRVRLGIRTRLLLAVVGALALALIIGVTAFNVILEQRLSASAESLARAQAQAELSSLKVANGKLVAPEGLEERGAVGSTSVGVRRRHDHREATRSCPLDERREFARREGLNGLVASRNPSASTHSPPSMTANASGRSSRACRSTRTRRRRRSLSSARSCSPSLFSPPSRSSPTGSSARHSCPYHA